MSDSINNDNMIRSRAIANIVARMKCVLSGRGDCGNQPPAILTPLGNTSLGMAQNIWGLSTDEANTAVRILGTKLQSPIIAYTLDDCGHASASQ